MRKLALPLGYGPQERLSQSQTMPMLPGHTYEEIREVVVAVILRREPVGFEPTQFANLVTGTAEVFARREAAPSQSVGRHDQPRLHAADAELVRDVFWDLFRQGFITLGMNDSNPMWPFFRLSHFGQETLATHSPYRFSRHRILCRDGQNRGARHLK